MSENLIRYAQGVDVLVHEAVDAAAVRARPGNREALEAIIAHHTTPEQASEVFTRVKPRLAVYSHAPNAEDVMTQTRKTYVPLYRPSRGSHSMPSWQGSSARRSSTHRGACRRMSFDSSGVAAQHALHQAAADANLSVRWWTPTLGRRERARGIGKPGVAGDS